MVWDFSLFNWFHGISGWSVFTDGIVIFFARHLAYILAGAAVFFIFKEKGLKAKLVVFFRLALTVLLSRGIIAGTIAYFYARPRPFVTLGFKPLINETNTSFPSGHGAFFFALGFAIFSLNRRWGYWFLSLAFLNGLARIFAGVHYPTDIVGGILVALASWAIVRTFLHKNNEKTDSQELREVQPEAGSQN
ncbi:MAG: phosphatase PAP2 family protein [Patescibacteria group bacterium]